MRAWLVASGISLALLWLTVSPALAQRDDAHARYGVALSTQAGASDEAAARDVLRREGPALGLDPSDALRVVRTTQAHGYVVVELARVVHGADVVGAPIVVRLRPDRAVDLLRVTPMPRPDGAWITNVPEAADEIGRRGAPFAGARVLDRRLVALVHEDRLRPAVELELGGAHRAERARAYVETRTLELLRVDLLTLDANGRVFPQNPTNDADVTMDLPLENLVSSTNLDGTYVQVASCDQLSADCNTVQRAVADTSGDFLYDPMSLAFDDAFSEVSAYFHTSLVVDYFRAAHAFTWSCAGLPRMDVVVNYSETPHVGYDNAMFVPGSRGSCGTLVFGQGFMHDYAYDGDVVYHEFGHAVTESISSLGYFATSIASNNYQPLAINEGTSDYWASAVQGDPNIGESIGSIEGFSGSLRGLDNDLACPGDLFGEGHYDGRIWSAFGWALRGIVGQTRADALWYTTMASLAGGVTLAEATNTLLATVSSEVTMGHVTEDERTQIMAAADARGLPDCSMFVPIDDGLRHDGYSGNSFVTGLSHGLAPLEYTVYVPPDVVDLEVRIDHPTLTGMVNVHFNTGSAVRATSSRISAQASVPLGRGGVAIFSRAQGLTPCTTVYVGIETTDLRAGESLYGIQATVTTTNETRACPPPTPDAGPPDAGHDAGDVADAGADGATGPAPSADCACRAGTSAGSAHGVALVMLALAFTLGRRRQRR